MRCISVPDDQRQRLLPRQAGFRQVLGGQNHAKRGVQGEVGDRVTAVDHRHEPFLQVLSLFGGGKGEKEGLSLYSAL